jgi:uncharacterized repeat protein (TIGR01451 family)
MKRFTQLSLRFALLVGILALLLAAVIGLAACSSAASDGPPAPETDVTQSCQDGTQDSGAAYRICMPPLPSWNGDLVLYAHGYVRYDEPVAIPEDQLVLGDVSLPAILNGLGYGFATTSYYTNGLAVREGIADLIDLVHVFTTTQGLTPTRIYLGGVSEGGLITTLAVERYPDVFDGGLAACGPVGGLRPQVNYYGDFRVVFDYFFPDLMPGEPLTVPQSLIDNWDTYYATVISPTIASPSSAYSLTQLMSVTGAAYVPEDPATMLTTTGRVLWYNVFATNDGKAKLGGQPFDNQARVYVGSENDARLNQEVERFQADQAALDEMQTHYETTGQLSVPLVTLHTTLDEGVPYWHEALYRAKVVANRATPWHVNIPVPRYGHCNFEPAEVVQAFLLLVDRVTNPRPDLSTSRKRVVDASGDAWVQAGETLTYTIAITNSGLLGSAILLTDTLPAGLTYVSNTLQVDYPDSGFTATLEGPRLLAHTQGYPSTPEGAVLAPGHAATITFAVRVSDPLPVGTHIVNEVELRDQQRGYTIRAATLRAGYQSYLPIVFSSP